MSQHETPPDETGTDTPPDTDAPADNTGDATEDGGEDGADAALLQPGDVIFGGEYAIRIPHPAGGYLAVLWNTNIKRIA